MDISINSGYNSSSSYSYSTSGSSNGSSASGSSSSSSSSSSNGSVPYNGSSSASAPVSSSEINTAHHAVVLHTHAAHVAPVGTGSANGRDSRYTNLFDFLFKRIYEFLNNGIRTQNCCDNVAALHTMTLVNRHYFAYGCSIFQVLENTMKRSILTREVYTPENALLIPDYVRIIPGNIRKIHEDLSKLNMSLCDAMAIIDPEAAEQDRVNLVVNALENNCTHLLKFLLASGLNPNIDWATQGKTIETILNCAIQKNDVDLVQALIQAGADVTAHRSDGKTPFMIAADLGAIEIMQALKNAGADINARDYRGRTALLNNVIANTGMVKFSGSEEVDNDAPKRVRALLQLGVDTEVRDPANQYTALLYAAMTCADTSILEMLIQNGANTLACDNDGMTALMLGVQYYELVNELDRVQIILQTSLHASHASERHTQYHRQAMLETRNHEGETALMMAVKIGDKAYRKEGDVKVVSMLIQAGANINARINERTIRERIESIPHLRGLLRG